MSRYSWNKFIFKTNPEYNSQTAKRSFHLKFIKRRGNSKFDRAEKNSLCPAGIIYLVYPFNTFCLIWEMWAEKWPHEWLGRVLGVLGLASSARNSQINQKIKGICYIMSHIICNTCHFWLGACSSVYLKKNHTFETQMISSNTQYIPYSHCCEYPGPTT